MLLSLELTWLRGVHPLSVGDFMVFRSARECSCVPPFTLSTASGELPGAQSVRAELVELRTAYGLLLPAPDRIGD